MKNIHKQLGFFIAFALAACKTAAPPGQNSVRLLGNTLKLDKDNKIYKRERLFQYGYQYIKNDTSYRALLVNEGDLILESMAQSHDSYPLVVKEINFKVIKLKLFEGRTSRYQSETVTTFDSLLDTFPPFPENNSNNVTLRLRVWQGLVENKHNVWLHPPRDCAFRILELNPFPYVKYPLAIGHTWQHSLIIGSSWSNPRWKVWEGNIVNKYHYEVKGHASISVDNTPLNCWVIHSTAESRLGSTQLVSYFHEEYGFVQLDYVNIDGSKITLKLSKLPI